MVGRPMAGANRFQANWMIHAESAKHATSSRTIPTMSSATFTAGEPPYNGCPEPGDVLAEAGTRLARHVDPEVLPGEDLDLGALDDERGPDVGRGPGGVALDRNTPDPLRGRRGRGTGRRVDRPAAGIRGAETL